MKKLFHTLILLCTFSLVQAQNELKARLEFGEAEKAFSEKNYETALKHLNEAETLIGKWTPVTSYLKIESLYALTDLGNFAAPTIQQLYEEVKKYMGHMSTLKSDDIPIERYKFVYAIEKNLKAMKLDERQIPEFVEAKKEFDSKNYTAALPLYEKLAEEKNSWAMRTLGLYYYYVLGVSKDSELAKKWYIKAIENDNIQALADLGDVYHDEENFEKALDLFLKAAEKDNTRAIFMLGYLYQHGQGVNQDYQKAQEYYLKAKQKNHIDAHYRIGVLYHIGGYGITQSLQTAMELYLKAVEKGSTNAMIQIAWIHLNGQEGKPMDAVKALYWYQKAIDKGDITAMPRIGNLYYQGEYGVAKDYAKAAEYYESYYENEKKNEAYLDNLIEIYSRGGYGIIKNKEKAKYWKNIRIN